MTSVNEGSAKPEGFAILPEPWEETYTEIVKPIIWLGKIKRWQAESIGYILWWGGPLLLILYHPGIEFRFAAAIASTWVIASMFASFLMRLNFDIDDEKKEIIP